MKEKTEEYNIAWIVAPPGNLRDSLCVLVCTLPQIERVVPHVDLYQAKRSGLLGKHPRLLLIDYKSFQAGMSDILHYFVDLQPSIDIIILVEDEKEFKEAQAGPAAVVLRKGVLASRLIVEIEQVISW